MPRLDGAGVDRADRDLVHAFALDPDERIVVRRGLEVNLPARGVVEVLAQRKHASRPGPVPQPLAVIGAALRMHAEQIIGGALHAVGGREQVRKPGIARVLALQRRA